MIRGKRLAGAPRSGRWGRRVTGRRERKQHPYSAWFLLVVAVAIIGTVAAWTWALDRQLREGILAQRREAVQRPDWVPLRPLPPHVPAAFLTVVDPAFLQRHPLRDGVANTTLPRELAAQIHQLGNGVGGQARELIMGPLLASRLTKRELLELYLNRVYLGEDDGWPIFGVYHAAREYFDKEPEALTLSEAATLAGLLLPPPVTDPERRPGAVGARRDEVLRQMWIEGTISEGEYHMAIAEPLGFQPGPEHAPMTRPADWAGEPEVIRVPANPLLLEDSLEE